MKRSREQIKADVMKRYEEEMDKLLDWQEKSHGPNLSEVEVEEELVLNPQILEEEPQARAKHTSYVAALVGRRRLGTCSGEKRCGGAGSRRLKRR